MSYYLLEHAEREHWYEGRRTCRHGIQPNLLPHLVVIHTSEQQPDFHGNDSGAENLARYAATTDRSVSWHHTVDADSDIAMLPDDYTAFHVRYYNRCSWGVEICTQAHRWADLPADYSDALLRRCAAAVRGVCVRNNIPIETVSKNLADRGRRGIIGHSLLDPARRTDPGSQFDWNLFLRYANKSHLKEEEVELKRGDAGPEVLFWKHRLKIAIERRGAKLGGEPNLDGLDYQVDQSFDGVTEAAVNRFKKSHGLDEDGTIDLQVMFAIEEEVLA